MKQTAHVATDLLDLNDLNAVLTAVKAFSDLGRHTNKGRKLHVFSLDEAR